jgi:hypothetical protein
MTNTIDSFRRNALRDVIRLHLDLGFTPNEIAEEFATALTDAVYVASPENGELVSGFVHLCETTHSLDPVEGLRILNAQDWSQEESSLESVTVYVDPETYPVGTFTYNKVDLEGVK